MTDLSPIPATAGEQGQHYELLKRAVPACLVNAAPQRRAALRQTRPVIPNWYGALSASDRDVLNRDLDAKCHSQNELDKSMLKIQEINDFAAPLLTAALVAAGHALDVEHVFLRLYIPIEDSFGRKTDGYRVKTFSLLQAALNNFEEQETTAGFFDAACGFVTPPNALGHFERHPATLKLEDFARLCRTLDLGSQYQQHLKTFLRPDQVVSQNLLRTRYITHQKDAFTAAARLALFKKDIGEDDFKLLMRVVSGEKKIMVGDKQVWYRTPSMMNLDLRGCVIIDPCVKYQYSDWFIAYIPDDPEHPIKRYENFQAFRQELTRQLTAYPVQPMGRQPQSGPAGYQVFLSRFVAQKNRPYYYRRFTKTMTDAPSEPWLINWLRSEQGAFWADLLAPDYVRSPISSILGNAHHTSRVPVEGPNLNINAYSIKGGIWAEDVDLWDTLYEGLRDQVFEDARTLAVSTVDADDASHSRRLSHYLSIGLLVVGTVSMVVPPLGEVMLVATLGQLMYEAFEGAIELGEGDREAAWSHITDVVENLAMLAVGAAAFHFVTSPAVESMKPVRLPDGKTRLWKPDLKPYERNIELPASSSADSDGLLRRNGDQVLTLGDKHFVLGDDPLPGAYRVQHPVRADAYQPEVRTNGDGVWVHEAEAPRSWEGTALMRRLGPVVEGFSDTQLERIRMSSGIEEGLLRRMYVETERTPSILQETADRNRAYDNAVSVGRQIAEGQMTDELSGYAATLMVELPDWPVGRGIEVFNAQAGSDVPIQYYTGDRTDPAPIRISQTELKGGGLPGRIVDSLSDDQLKKLLGGQYLERGTELRTVALKNRLAESAVRHRTRLFRSLNSEPKRPADPAVQLIQRDFKRLSTRMARQVLSDATTAELEIIRTREKIPLRLAQVARQWQNEIRLTQAYEGLYLPELAGPDTEALALNTLQRLPGWKNELRIEIREATLNGPLRASCGPQQASSHKVLVHLGEGKYQAFDAQGSELHGANGLYGSIQHALTDRHRLSIGLPHVGQGETLQGLIVQQALPRGALRQVLGIAPARLPFFRPPHRFPGGKRGYPLSGRGTGGRRGIIEERVRTLYPDITDVELTEYLLSKPLEDDRWLKALEAEYKALDHGLRLWYWGGAQDAESLSAKKEFLNAIRLAWQASADDDIDAVGRYRGQKIQLEGEGLGPYLETLSVLPGNFDHVTALNLQGIGLTDRGTVFLSTFSKLRSLELDMNELTRLPEAVGKMPHLEVLGLSDNEVVLTSETARQIRDLRRMTSLSLDGNPLGQAPDITLMYQLHLLRLADTGLNRWPVGIFSRPRSHRFILDLTANAITEIPDVAPGSERAQILARTAVSRELLSPQALDRLNLYIESVGLEPERHFPPRGTQDSAHWMDGLTHLEWTQKQPLWDALEETHGSEPFFNEIRKLSESADALTPASRPDLTLKVWRMLEAMAEDTGLRENLFQMARVPTRCVDGGAHLFGSMGVEVLLHEACAISDAALRKAELLKLAKGKSRLDELARIGNARVADLLAGGGRCLPEYNEDGHLVAQFDDRGNERLPIDVVEVHMVYLTRLGSRLDLPWQPGNMMFAEPDVTPLMVEDAYNHVLILEEGDLLRENVLDQTFWVEYLEGANPDAYKAVDAKNDALLSLLEAQQEWADNGGLSAQQKQDLRNTIETSAALLGIPAADVSPGKVMSNADYFAYSGRLGEERKNILRGLTDEAMGRGQSQS